ncbi:MAG TPA: TRZ/ATZ family hydrolase [Burkholderiales bacterium]|nr:TRZ/ATZ family hydrolase [Burkholderiales bacterium]
MENIRAPADLIIDAAWIIPIEPQGIVLREHSVVVRDGAILALMPTSRAHERFEATDQLHLDKHVLIPGLVNTHTHAAMTLLRGYADDLPLMTWLKDHIWPVEAKHVSAQFVYDGTMLAAVEMLRGGITCVNDMYFFPGDAARAYARCGMRACVGMVVTEFATNYAVDADDYIDKGLAVRDEFRDHPLLSFCMAPHSPYTVTDKTFGRLLTIAEELDLPIHLHLHETIEEIEASIAEHGMRPFERLQQLGLVSPRLIGVHAVHLTPGEIEALALSGCSIAHCPTSNLKLASGFAPAAALLAADANVALGTDGAASNNRLDMFAEMRMAAVLGKAVANNAAALPAHEILRCATLRGARALGLDHLIGSIEVGKSADLTAVRMDDLETLPCYDPASHLVYVADRHQVSHVWVAGQLHIREGSPIGLEISELEIPVRLWHNRMAS